MSDRLLSLSFYRGFNVEYREVAGQRLAVVKQGDVTLAEFVEERGGPDAINLAFEWVEAQAK